jgi:uncharacterized protein (DUF983 family)
MQIIAQCPGCGNSWLLDAAAADRRMTCQNCNMLYKVPKLEEVPKATRIVKHAKGSIYVDHNGNTYG